MINKVNGNDYYDYTKLNMPASADMTGNGEKFSLDYQRADDKKEEEEGKEKISRESAGKNPAGNSARSALREGVRLELSGREQTGTLDGPQGISELLDTVRSWIASALQSFKELLNRIWNDPVPENEVLPIEEVPVEAADRLSEEYLDINPVNSADTDSRPLPDGADKDREIQKYLRSGNLEQVINLLTEDGHRTIAKNSTLLTYYDRNGRFTSISASDQDRILHGDRNVKKL